LIIRGHSIPQIPHINNPILIRIIAQTRFFSQCQQVEQFFRLFLECFLVIEVMAHHEVLEVEAHVGFFCLGFDEGLHLIV